MVILGKYQGGPWYAVKYIYIYDYDLWFTEENLLKSVESYENKLFFSSREMWGKLWRWIRKLKEVMKINEESFEKNWGKFGGKVRKVMKIDEEIFRKSEESYEDRWGKF